MGDLTLIKKEKKTATRANRFTMSGLKLSQLLFTTNLLKNLHRHNNVQTTILDHIYINDINAV